MNYFLLVTKYDFSLMFTFFISLLLLYFAEVEKFKVILKAKPAMSRLVRMCFAQPGYGPGLLPVYYPIINALLNPISVVPLLKYILSILFFYLSKIFKQYFNLIE